MILGYNTNGLAHHDPLDAIALLADIGYRSVAITVDHGTLNPFDDRLPEQTGQVRSRLEQFGMRSVIETGARYLLDPQVKHEPTLMSADPSRRAKRVDFLQRAVDIAFALGSDCVSFWSGVLRDDVSPAAAMDRLATAMRPVIDYAAEMDIPLGFEPEPGMFIDTMDRYALLLEHVDASHFRLTLDLGHLHCQGETPIADAVRRWADRIVNVHVEDMRRGVHEHLMFGAGEIDFPPAIDALARVRYQGALHVELSRHSHEGPSAARQAFEFLQPLVSGE